MAAETGEGKGENIREWDTNGIKFRSVKLNGYWYTVRVSKPRETVKVGVVAYWLASGRWLCGCGRRHRAYILACQCGKPAPGAPNTQTGCRV